MQNIAISAQWTGQIGMAETRDNGYTSIRQAPEEEEAQCSFTIDLIKKVKFRIVFKSADGGAFFSHYPRGLLINLLYDVFDFR